MGLLKPEIPAMPILFRKMTFDYTWDTRLFIGMQLDFCSIQVSFRVRYGAPQVSEEPQKN